MLKRRKILAHLALKQIIPALVVAALFAVPVQPAWAGNSAAADFVSDLGDRAVKALADKSMSDARRKTEFRRLFLKGFDVDVLSRFVVGRYWRRAGKDERKEYQVLFTDFIVETYAARFSGYSGETIEVDGSRKASEKDTLVNSRIVRPQGAAIRVDWRVRNRNGVLKIVDIVVAGVSMAITQRAEFASVIRRGGGGFKNLITELKSKTGR